MTQSRNVWTASGKKFAAAYFAPLYSCEDSAYSDRFNNFIAVEYDQNVQNRRTNRTGFGSIPGKMANDYGLPTTRPEITDTTRPYQFTRTTAVDKQAARVTQCKRLR
jgi:hypothetical protein